MRRVAVALVAGLAAATFAAPSDAAYCAGTQDIGRLCVEVSTGTRPSVGLIQESDCAYVLSDTECVEFSYYRPGPVSPGGPVTFDLTCTGVFAFTSEC